MIFGKYFLDFSQKISKNWIFNYTNSGSWPFWGYEGVKKIFYCQSLTEWKFVNPGLLKIWIFPGKSGFSKNPSSFTLHMVSTVYLTSWFNKNAKFLKHMLDQIA